jgi:hypothetical protein
VHHSLLLALVLVLVLVLVLEMTVTYPRPDYLAPAFIPGETRPAYPKSRRDSRI